MTVTCEREINNLADLKEEVDESLERTPESDRRRKKRVALEAWTEWTEQAKVLEGKLSRRNKRVDFLTNEIHQLVGLYSVFVGVVFSAVVSDRVHCQHIWSPILLCFLPCFIIVHIINRKLKIIYRIRGEIFDDERSRKANLRNLSQLRLKGYKGFDFNTDVREQAPTSGGQTGETLTITTRGVVIVLLLLSVVVVGSFYHILCLTKTQGDCDSTDFAPGGDLWIRPS